MRTLALALLVCVTLQPFAVGHGELHEQIAELTARLQKDPGNAELLLQRANLHRLHGDWVAGAADYDAVETRAPELKIVHLGRGKLFLAIGRLEAAEAELDIFLAAHPEHAEAFVTRARVRLQQKNHLAAAGDFAKAIKLSARPEPEYYLERAQALAAAGNSHVVEALQVLDEGAARLGNLPTLGLYAVELEVKRGAFDAALARIDRLSATVRRKEAWLARRGDILEQAGRREEAQQTFREARTAIAALPEHLRMTQAMVSLETRLKAKTADTAKP